MHSNAGSDPGVPNIGNRPAPLPRERNLGEPFANTEVDSVLVGLNWSHAFNDNWVIRHRFNTNLSQQNDVGLFFAGDPASDGTIDRGVFIEDVPRETYYTTLDLTGKLSTWGVNHTILIGGDYFRSSDGGSTLLFGSIGSINIFRPVFLNDINPLPALTPFVSGGTTSFYGLYLQDQIDLPYNLHALAGFRYDNAQDDNTTTFLGSTTRTRQDDDRVSPRGGLLWRPIPELSLYGSYTENFGASNGQNLDGSSLPPESAQQWELGAKTELWDERFTGSVAYFDLTKQNLTVPDPNNPIFSRTVGEAETRGVEFDVAGEILAGWRVIGAYTYMPFAEITKDNDASGGPGNQGKRLFQAPRHFGSLWNTYEFQGGGFKGLKFGAGVVAAGQRQGDSGNTYQMPGYATVNLLASYAWKVGPTKLTAQLNMDNLLDKTYFTGSNTGNQIFYAAPRTFLGSIRLEF